MKNNPKKARDNGMSTTATVAAATSAAGLVGIGYYLSSAQSRKKYFGAAPLLSAGAVFLGTYVTKQDPIVQGVSTVMGYIGGVLLGSYLAERKIAASDYVQELMKQGLTEEEAIEKAQQMEENRQWCEDSPYLSWVSPSCYSLESAETLRTAAVEKEADKEWCSSSPYLSYLNYKCY